MINGYMEKSNKYEQISRAYYLFISAFMWPINSNKEKRNCRVQKEIVYCDP